MNAEVIEKLPFSTYREIDAEHSTTLRLMERSPLDYNHARKNPRPDTDVLRAGRAGHTATLEIERFLLEYALYEGRRQGKKWEAFKAANPGKTILTPDIYHRAIGMRESVRRHPVASALLAEKGRNELTIVWRHERTGIKCKVRIDAERESACVDVKTTRDPSPKAFARTLANYGYDFQAGMYTSGRTAAGFKDKPFKIVAVGSLEPHDVVVYTLTPETVSFGAGKFEAALTRLDECRKANHWPGIAPSEALPLELPAWAMPSTDDDQLMFEGESLF
jgi:hypothetical protein